MRIAMWVCVAAVAASAAACGGKQYVTVTIPPRLDLSGVERVGLTTFTVQNAKGTLHELATQRFAEQVLAASRGLEVLELGEPGPFLQDAEQTVFGPSAARAVGAAHAVPVVFGGHMTVSNVTPSGGLTRFGLPHVEATVAVELSVALYSTDTGGTLWRERGTASERVGHLTLTRGEPSFSATDPDAAYGRLVDRLVALVSRDLLPTYERR